MLHDNIKNNLENQVDEPLYTSYEVCSLENPIFNEINEKAREKAQTFKHRIDQYLDESGSQREVSFYTVPMTDRYVNEQFTFVQDYISDLEEGGYYGVSSTDFSRKRSRIDRDNPSTMRLCQEKQGFGAWMDTIPRAEALKVLENPNMTTLPDGSELSEEARDVFRNALDPIGIRSRAEIVQGVIVDHIMEQQQYDRDADIHSVSLACGTAGTVFDALQQLKAHGYRAPRATLVDYDPSALQFAQERAESDGYGDMVTTVRENILRPSGLVNEKHDNGLQSKSADVVDLVGFLEYLQTEDKKYTYNGVISEKSKQAGAVTMLANAYKLVKPGGVMVFGNMHDERDQKSFIADIIQWPHIKPRSMEECVELVDKTGIEGDLDVYYPADGVYAVYVVKKPL